MRPQTDFAPQLFNWSSQRLSRRRFQVANGPDTQGQLVGGIPLNSVASITGMPRFEL